VVEDQARGQVYGAGPVQGAAGAVAGAGDGADAVEPVAVYLRSGYIVKVGRGFDEEAFARVVAVLEGG
jgi:hypothetical protein